MKRYQIHAGRLLNFGSGLLGAWVLSIPLTAAVAQPPTTGPGGIISTAANPTELPVEIEVETGIASLKQAPLWKELVQMLEDPYLAPLEGSAFAPSAVERRPGFGVEMPPLNVWPLGYNFLTAQPLWIKTSDAEISWDQPGPLFNPEQVVIVSADPANPNVPDEIREVIGELVILLNGESPDGGENVLDDDRCVAPSGCLVVLNPEVGDWDETDDEETDLLPPNMTVVGVPAVFDGMLHEGEIVNGELELEEVEELEMPVNEEHFIADRYMAEVLGKALFWDMQVGSDGVQACGSCHFHAGVDNRTRNQLNPNINDVYEVTSVAGSPTSNVEVLASDFPFHKRQAEDLEGDGADPSVMLSDANDVMASMGVSRFTLFEDVIVGQGNRNAPGAFSDEYSIDGAGFGVAALVPDVGTPADDPIAIMQGVRRIEPRNTPTIHGAAFNLDNFWDARARFDYNGGSVFGPSDPFFHVFVACVGQGGGIRELAHPAEAELEAGPRPLCDWTEAGGNYAGIDEGEGPLPVRIKFSSLGSQAMGPPLSNFEMAFDGRNWPKIGKKLLQNNVVPLANQLVAIDDSRLGPWSNQGGSQCIAEGLPTAVGMPGLCISYPELIRSSFRQELYSGTGNQHLAGSAVDMDNNCDPGDQIHEEDTEATCDPFDGYVLEIANGPANNRDTDEFTIMEANFSLFFGLSVQAYESLTIPDDTPFDRFLDANPFAGNGVGQPGEQGVLYPTLIPDLVRTPGACPVGTTRDGAICLVDDDPSTAEFDGFGPEQLFGFDIFAGANLTAALHMEEETRNPLGFGSNPFTRTARCMLCHLGPEQTDHSINISHGIIKGDAEFEFPTPQSLTDPNGLEVPAPEPPGPIAAVGGLILAEEVEETPQDAVEVEPMNFAALDILADDPATPWLDESTFNDSYIGQPSAFSFGDQGIYNVGLRPIAEDIGRGGDDPFGWPLSRSALTLMNVGGEDFEPCDNPADAAGTPFGACAMDNFNPSEGAAGGLFEELESDINPGYEREPINPLLPEYLAEWVNAVPAGELHPSIDEMAGFAPNTITVPNGGPAIEFGENMFGADLHCGVFNPAFGTGSPNFSWGPRCPNNQSGVPGNILVDNILNDPTVYVPGSLVAPLHGTWPFSNRVRRDGQFKAPPLRNVEMTGPYFHTGSYLTLRQVVDFYMRGGDFPLTNAENRDQHMVDVDVQVFGFGTSRTQSNGGPIPDVPFADALPDTPNQYDFMPDTDHPNTPEPASSNPLSARIALVKYLLSLTDPRVKYERAPFDHPEIFVPIDGAAPENTGGRTQLLSQSGVPCPVPGPNPGPVCFRQVAASGEGGISTPLPNFLNVLSVETPGQVDHFDVDPSLP